MKGYAWLTVILLAAAYCAEGWIYRDYNLDEFQVATGYLKDANPELFSKDFIWSKPEMVRNLHVNVRRAMKWTGSLFGGIVDEPIDWYLLWLPVAFVLFFLGNYLLARHWSGSDRAAFVVACCFALVRRTVWDWWGIGPTFTMSARGLVLSVLPLAFWCYLRWARTSLTRLAVFGCLWGLICNLHPLSGWGLIEFLVLTLLLSERFSAEAWKQSCILVLTVALGSLPFIMIWTDVTVIPEAQRADAGFVHQFLSYYELIQPDTPRYLRGFLTDLSVPLLVAVTGVWVMRRQNNVRVDQWEKELCLRWIPLVLSMTALILIVGVVMRKQGMIVPVFVTEHSRNIKMIYLVLPLFMGVSLMSFERQIQSLWMVRAGLFGLVLLSWSINLPGHKWARYLIARSHLGGDSVEEKVAGHLLESRQDWEVANWARSHTRPDDLFYFDSYEFRYYSRRSLVFCYTDRPCVAFHPSHEMEEWDRKRQEIMPLKLVGDSEGMLKQAVKYGADYVVIRHDWRPVAHERPVWSNSKYSIYQISTMNGSP